MTLQEFANILSQLVKSNENIGDLTFPIDFQDTNASTIEHENEYQRLLSEGLYNEAEQYRASHPELEPRIFDSTKANLLQTLGITSFQYAKEERDAANISYDNSETGIDALTVQDAVDSMILEGGSSRDITIAQYKALDAAGQVRKGTTYYIEDDGDFIEKSGYELREVNVLPLDASKKPKTLFIVG